MKINNATPPYYAVIFTSILTEDQDGYPEMAEKLHDLAKLQPGFLGLDSARENTGITVSYWTDLAAIANWKENATHKLAQVLGKEKWYKHFTTRIARVEREYSFNSGE